MVNANYVTTAWMPKMNGQGHMKMKIDLEVRWRHRSQPLWLECWPAMLQCTRKVIPYQRAHTNRQMRALIALRVIFFGNFLTLCWLFVTL